MIKKHIPNIITCLNLLSGALAIICTLTEGRLGMEAWAPFLIILAAIFDFFDGLVARWLGVSSAIGKDLDSLADVISFGLAPATLMVQVLWELGYQPYLSLFPLLIAAFAALRLAKFNNDTRQTTSFVGLPVPANALFWIGLQSVLPQLKLMLGETILLLIVLVLVLLFSYLMVSELPMFSFKLGKERSLKAWTPQLTLISVAVLSLIFFQTFACSLTIVAYVLISALQIGRPRA